MAQGAELRAGKVPVGRQSGRWKDSLFLPRERKCTFSRKGYFARKFLGKSTMATKLSYLRHLNQQPATGLKESFYKIEGYYE